MRTNQKTTSAPKRIILDIYAVWDCFELSKPAEVTGVIVPVTFENRVRAVQRPSDTIVDRVIEDIAEGSINWATHILPDPSTAIAPGSVRLQSDCHTPTVV